MTLPKFRQSHCWFSIADYRAGIALAALSLLIPTTNAGTLVKNWQIAGRNGDCTGLALSSDGARLVTTHNGDYLRVWRTNDKRVIFSDTPKGTGMILVSAPYSSPDFFVARTGGFGVHVELRDFSTGLLVLDTLVSADIPAVLAIGSGSDNAFYMRVNNPSGADQIVEYTKSGNNFSKTFTWNVECNNAIAASEDGLWMAVTTNTAVKVFSLSNKSQVPSKVISAAVGGNSPGANVMSFSPNGDFLVVRNGNGASLIETTTWTIVRTLSANGVPAVAWEPGSLSYYTFATSSGNLIRTRTNGTEAFDAFPSGFTPGAQVISRALNGNNIAFDARPNVRMWSALNADTGSFAAMGEKVYAADYAFDDSSVITIDEHHIVQWDASSGAGKTLVYEPDTASFKRISGAGTGGGQLIVSTKTAIYRRDPNSGGIQQSVPASVRDLRHENTHDPSARSNSVLVTKAGFGALGSVIGYVDTGTTNSITFRKSSDLGLIGSASQGETITDAYLSADSRFFVTVSANFVRTWSPTNLLAPLGSLAISSPGILKSVAVSTGGTYMAVALDNVIKLFKRAGSTYNLITTKTFSGDVRFNKLSFMKQQSKLLAFMDRVGATPDPRLMFLTVESLVVTDSQVANYGTWSTFQASNYDQYVFFCDWSNLGCGWQCWNSLRPAEPWTLDRSPSTVSGGLPVTCTVNLTAPAPTGGLVVDLYSGNPAIAQPAVPSVTVAAGQTSAQFTVNTFIVAGIQSVAITAVHNKPAKGKIIVTP